MSRNNEKCFENSSELSKENNEHSTHNNDGGGPEDTVSSQAENESNKEAVDQMNYMVNQTSNNIKNILNLGQEMPDEDCLSKINNSKSIKKLRLKTSSPKCHHKSGRVKKRWSCNRKRHHRQLRQIQNSIRGALQDHAGTSTAQQGFCMEGTDENFQNHITLRPAEERHVSYDKEFEDLYEDVQNDFYEKMTKFELIDRWIQTEDQIELIDKHLNAIRERKRLLGLNGRDVDSEIAKIEVFRAEINKLAEENQKLQLMNETLESNLQMSS